MNGHYDQGQCPACPWCGYIHEDVVEDFVVPNSGKPHVTQCDNCERSFEACEISKGKFTVGKTTRSAPYGR